MKPLRRPVFLAPNPYRRRRLGDAARLLPLAGAFLMILPMLWAPAGREGHVHSGDVIWYLSVWALLILAAAALAPGLARPEEEEARASRQMMTEGEPWGAGSEPVPAVGTGKGREGPGQADPALRAGGSAEASSFEAGSAQIRSSRATLSQVEETPVRERGIKGGDNVL